MISRPDNKWLQEGFNKEIRKNKDESWPKITIITPSYNQGQFIEETILSVLCQNYPNLEYMVFDGGSNDNTVEIIKKYEDYIDYWESNKDRGQSDAINKGFRKTTGDIVTWLNSDDLFFPNTLFNIAKLFKEKGNYRQIIYGEGDYLIDKYNIGLYNKTAKLAKKHPLELVDYIIQPSCFWGKVVIDEIGLLSENLHYGFDWDWFITAKRHDIPFTFTPQRFSVYRIHADHKSSSAGMKRTTELAKIYEKNVSKEVSEAYIKLNTNNKVLSIKRLVRRIPVVYKMFLYAVWKSGFNHIPYDTFVSISRM
jgi:glycosyltransferase involved in cell wall biosynthesis